MWEKELTVCIEAAKAAQKTIMEIYNSNDFFVEIKSDDSPVTKGDREAEKIIKDILLSNFPNYAFLGEEDKDDLSRIQNDYCFIVDPIDGTKDFIKKDDEFTINIALSYKHKIVVGVILVPAKDILYYAVDGKGSYKVNHGFAKQIFVSNKTNDLICLTSHFHTIDSEINFMKKLGFRVKDIVPVGSSYKGCLIAEGSAEVNVKLSGHTKEWDIAAMSIIVKEAGGLFIKPNKEEYLFNKENIYNVDGYLILNNIENFIS